MGEMKKVSFLILLIGVSGLAILYYSVCLDLQKQSREKFYGVARDYSSIIRGRFALREEELNSIVLLFKSSQDVSRLELEDFVKYIIDKDDIDLVCYKGEDYTYSSDMNKTEECLRSIEAESKTLLNDSENFILKRSVYSRGGQKGHISLQIDLRKFLSDSNRFKLDYSIGPLADAKSSGAVKQYQMSAINFGNSGELFFVGEKEKFRLGFPKAYLLVMFLIGVCLLFIVYIIELVLKRGEVIRQKLEEQEKIVLEQREKMVSQEKLASLGTLAAGVAHEIKNPLNIIKNSIEVLNSFFKDYSIDKITEVSKDKTSEDYEFLCEDYNDARKGLTFIDENVVRANNVVASMLELGNQTGENEKVLVSLKDFVSETVYLLKKSKPRGTGREVVVEESYASNMPDVEIFKNEFRRALLNLLDNAYYETERYRKQADPMVEVSVNFSKVNSTFSIDIIDNGPGISDKNKKAIFEPFVTTKPTGQGTGLGLSLTVDVLSKHDATLDLVSEEGNGAKFSINLPLGTSVGGK